MIRYLLLLLLVVPLSAQDDKTILLGITVMDVITTNHILDIGGVELNPIVRPLTERQFLFLAIKLGATYFFLNRKPTKKQIRTANLVLGSVVVNNLYQIRKHYAQKK